MANRSDRDSPSLNHVVGEQPAGEMRRGSADSIKACREISTATRPDIKLQPSLSNSTRKIPWQTGGVHINVMVSNVHPNSGDGGILTEQVHLAYSKIKCSYTQQKIAGGTGGSTMGGWDAAAKKVAT